MNNENQPPSLPAVPDTKEEAVDAASRNKAEDWRHDPQKVEDHRIFTEEVRRARALEEPGAVAANTVQGPMEHFLKCWPEFFSALLDGTKTFEARKKDRDFRVGDTLELYEFVPFDGSFTGRSLSRKVTYILEGSGTVGTQFGVQSGYVVMGLAPSVESKAPKSEAGSEFSQIPFETGGRNALNLQRTLEALNPLADNFGHWFAGMSEEDKKKPCTFSPLTWADAERAWDARRLVEDALQSAQAASDGKEQGAPRQLTKDLSGASNGLPSSVTETSANRNEPPSPAHPSSSATVRGPMEELVSRIQNYLGNGGLFNPEYMEHEKVRDLLIDVRDFLSAPPLPDNGEAVQTKDLEE